MRYLKGKKIGVIGLGNMGHAILKGLISPGGAVAKNTAISGYDCDAAKCRAIKKELRISIADSVASFAHSSEVIVIAVKPQHMGPVLEGLSFYTKGRLFISIAAGITTRRIEKSLECARARRPRVVRVMPNTPALVGEGMSAICKGRYATQADLKTANAIFASVGETIDISEKYFDLVTAISGSGPAYFFYLKEALIEAAAHLGMDKKTAKILVLKTALGSARLLLESGHEPGILRQRVTSKGGTTEQAIKVFDKAEFKQIVERAVRAAAKRSKELSESTFSLTCPLPVGERIKVRGKSER